MFDRQSIYIYAKNIVTKKGKDMLKPICVEGWDITGGFAGGTECVEGDGGTAIIKPCGRCPTPRPRQGDEE